MAEVTSSAWLTPFSCRIFVGESGVLVRVARGGFQPYSRGRNSQHLQHAQHIPSLIAARPQPVDASARDQDVRSLALAIQFGGVDQTVARFVEINRGSGIVGGAGASSQHDDDVRRRHRRRRQMSPLQRSHQAERHPTVCPQPQHRQSQGDDSGSPALASFQQESQRQQDASQTQRVDEQRQELGEKDEH